MGVGRRGRWRRTDQTGALHRGNTDDSAQAQRRLGDSARASAARPCSFLSPVYYPSLRSQQRRSQRRMTGCWAQETCAAVDRRYWTDANPRNGGYSGALRGICAQLACSRILGTDLSMRSCSEAGFSAPHHMPRGAGADSPCSNHQWKRLRRRGVVCSLSYVHGRDGLTRISRNRTDKKCSHNKFSWPQHLPAASSETSDWVHTSATDSNEM
ncbi:hypothetical protein C8Q74DRAFT_836408 [Fomes fomentarius]|nr:hypothetical protein C8Q74DRAFT_836408 [Fomes fomentarius]